MPPLHTEKSASRLDMTKQDLIAEIEALERSQKTAGAQDAWLRAIFEYAPIEIVLKDTDGRIVAISGNVGADLGHKAEDFIGRTTADFLPAHIAEVYMAADRQVMESGQSSQQEVVEEVDGAIRHSLNAKFPLRDDNGVITGICSLTTNITELKRSEAALRKAHDSLERQVAERTRALTEEIEERKQAEEALVHAKEEAEKASRAKSEFLSSMSHELRTPMNAILGFAQLLQYNPREPLSKTQNASIDSILRGGRHLLELIEQVLELAKIEAGHLSLNIGHTPTQPVIDHSLILIRDRADRDGIKIIDQTDNAPLPNLWTDSTRLTQVLLNLLSNAVKYNRKNGTVTLSCQTTPDGLLRISVQDTGYGISPEKQSDLFKPFERLGLEAGAIEGTGIGLTITKQIIELLGGQIGFESAPEKGSTFWVDVPLSEQQDQDAIRQEAVPPTDRIIQTPDESIVRRTVLYIEDNPDNMRLMEALVGRIANTTLLTADTAWLGLEVATRELPDLILMDINLPGMSGLEALQHLRNAATTKDIPVIAVTAAAMPKDVEAGLQAGFMHYITKPLNVRHFLQTLEETLEDIKKPV